MAEKEEAGKSLVFPIKGHDRCPQCGCEERIGQQKITELKQTGVLEEHMFPKGPVWMMPLIDQSKPIMVSPLSIEKPKIPILSYFYDVCANTGCLHVYITGIDFVIQEVALPSMPLTPPGQGMRGNLPPGFGRG